MGSKEFKVPLLCYYRENPSAKHFIFHCLKRAQMRSLEAIGLSRVSKTMNLVT